MANSRTPTPKPTSQAPKDGNAIRVVESQRASYIVAPRRGPGGLAPQAFETFSRTLGDMPGVEVVKRVKRPRTNRTGDLDALGLSPLGTSGGADDVLVVSMEPAHAALVGREMAAAGQGEVYEDRPLTHGEVAGPALLETFSTRAFGGGTEERELRFRVTGADGEAIESARVVLTGDAMPREGTTNGRGEVSVALVTLPGGKARALHVSAPRDHWDCYLLSPTLEGDGPFAVELQPIRPSLEANGRGGSRTKCDDGVAAGLRGWAQDAMGLGALSMNADGRGVKVAVVDSGIDASHPLLGHVAGGVDLVSNSTDGWRKDGSGHGTHVAGLIGAKPTEKLPFRGVVPGADLHSIRVFEGAREHMLLEAIDYCIENDIDVVNMSLGSASTISPVVEEALAEAVEHGIAIFAATGNSADDVKFPALSGFTCGVGAVGHIAHLPPHGSDRFNIQGPGGTDQLPIFSARFSCHGPQVTCAGPGVATVSCALGDGLTAMSGTSMASPLVAGLAALLLAHHSALEAVRYDRSRARVEALFALLAELCHPLPLDPLKVGAGMPRLDEATAAAMNRAASGTGDVNDGAVAETDTVATAPIFTFAAPVPGPVGMVSGGMVPLSASVAAPGAWASYGLLRAI